MVVKIFPMPHIYSIITDHFEVNSDIDYSIILPDDGRHYGNQYSFHTTKSLTCIMNGSCNIIRPYKKRNKEYMNLAVDVIVHKYHLSEVEAYRAVKQSF